MNPTPRIVGARWRGEGHAARHQPCCDALLIAEEEAQQLSGFVICDGAGGTAAVARSAQLSARAGWHALRLLRQQLIRIQLQPDHRDGHGLEQRFLSAFWHRRSPGPVADHTLLACLWDQQRLLVAQVGDSSLLVQRHGQWQLALLPAHGEYANETTFLRPNTTPDGLRLWWAPAHTVQAVIGFSDGLEAAFLCEQQPNAALADLVIEAHRLRLGWRGYPAWLAQSLSDPALAALSDDDRTLVVASRFPRGQR